LFGTKICFKDVLKITNKPLNFVPQTSLSESSDIEPYNFNNDKFNILYCGNLGLIQQIDLIPEAMKMVEDDNVVFHVIGRGPKMSLLESKIKEYGLENKLIFHGSIPAKYSAAYFTSADALYVSLKNEGFVGKTIPNKLTMSMAFAKPVLAMLDGDGKDLLMKTNGGIFVEQNAQALAKGIVEISNINKKDLEEMGNRNREYYLNHFSQESISKQIIKYLEVEVANKIN
jgi:glycosyltransferase involved in cell wall biosynthesis